MQQNRTATVRTTGSIQIQMQLQIQQKHTSHHITSHYNASALTLEDFVEVSFFDIFLQPGGQAGVHWRAACIKSVFSRTIRKKAQNTVARRKKKIVYMVALSTHKVNTMFIFQHKRQQQKIILQLQYKSSAQPCTYWLDNCNKQLYKYWLECVPESTMCL